MPAASVIVLHHLLALVTQNSGMATNSALPQEILSLIALQLNTESSLSHTDTTPDDLRKEGDPSDDLMTALTDAVSTTLVSISEFYDSPEEDQHTKTKEERLERALRIPERVQADLLRIESGEQDLISHQALLRDLNRDVTSLHRDVLAALPPLLETLTSQTIERTNRSHALLLQTSSTLLLKIALLPLRFLSALFAANPSLGPALISYQSALGRRTLRAEATKRKLEARLAEYKAATEGSGMASRGTEQTRFEALLEHRETIKKAKKEVERDLKRLGWVGNICD